MKRCSTSLAIREINTNRNYNEIPPHTCQNGYYQQDRWEQVLERLWRKRNPHSQPVGMYTVQPLRKQVWRFPGKNKNRITVWPSNLCSGHPPEQLTNVGRDLCTAMLTAALFPAAETWRQQKCPSTKVPERARRLGFRWRNNKTTVFQWLFSKRWGPEASSQ